MGRTQHVVIAAVHPTHLVFAVAHPYVEYATASDVVVTRAASGARYDLVVCCDCVGTAFVTQLTSGPLGLIPPEVLGAVRRFSPDWLVEDPRWLVGTTLRGRFDARYELKADLRRTVACLAAESLELLVGDR
jgi:hypothetical protein